MLPVDTTGTMTAGGNAPPTPAHPAEPPYGREPQVGANVITPQLADVTTQHQNLPSPPTPASAMHVQEFSLHSQGLLERKCKA